MKRQVFAGEARGAQRDRTVVTVGGKHNISEGKTWGNPSNLIVEAVRILDLWVKINHFFFFFFLLLFLTDGALRRSEAHTQRACIRRPAFRHTHCLQIGSRRLLRVCLFCCVWSSLVQRLLEGIPGVLWHTLPWVGDPCH